jgi:subtilisin
MYKPIGRLTLVILVLFMVLWLFVPSRTPAQSANVSPRQVIVTWRSSSQPAERGIAAQSAGGLVIREWPFGPSSLVWLPNSTAEERLAHNPLVIQVAPNRRLYPAGDMQGFWPASGPPHCADCGGGGGSETQSVPYVVGRVGASPGFVSFTGQGVGVAVMDTGINGQHRDLIRADGSRVVSQNCYKVPGSVFGCDSDIWLAPGGHGTKVAGVIAAVNNNIDLVGVAPQSSIYNVNIFHSDPQYCYPYTICSRDSDMIDGIAWINANYNSVSPPISVVNISMVRPGTPSDPNYALQAAFDELKQRRIIPVVAAGNDPTKEVADFVPANFGDRVMAIASTTAVLGTDDGSICSAFPHVPEDTASWFTTDGALDPNTKVGVTISAPGEDQEDIVKTQSHCSLQSVGALVLSVDGGVTRDAGTSISTAVVAGVVALMEQQAASLGTVITVGGTRDKIRSMANRISDVPLDSTYIDYTFDGEREGIVWAPGALQ